MSLFSSLNISGSGLSAERLRMDVIANNIANANTTKGVDGQPYQRQEVVFEPRVKPTLFLLPFDSKSQASSLDSRIGDGVRVAGVVSDPTPGKLVYDPGNPEADASGYVHMPNVNIVNEMVDMLSASRAYEANVTAINATKGMAEKALAIGQA